MCGHPPAPNWPALRFRERARPDGSRRLSHPRLKISANTTYIVSYFAPKGSYASDEYYSWKNVAGGSLHVSGRRPVLMYMVLLPASPNSTWHSINYWVDVVFVPANSQPVPTPSLYSISGTAGGSGATVTLSGAASGVVTADAAGSFAFAGFRMDRM